MKRLGCAWTIVGVFLAGAALAATNSWTSQKTGAWHDLTWSLGVRPDVSQDGIMVTNYGQKAIIIDATTRDSFPATLTISNLYVGGTSLSTNTVMLNYTGTSHPLRVFNNITVNAHGVLLNLFGAISLEWDTNQLMISGGIVNQDGGSNHFGGNCYVGYMTNYGCYNLTNGTLWMGNVTVDSGGVFNQIDGTTTIAGGITTLQSYYSVGTGAQYTVVHGTLDAAGLTLSGDGNFYQGDSAITLGGLIVGELRNRFTGSRGSYYLTNGTVTTGETIIGDVSDGYFF